MTISSHSSHDVLILGGGPAGATLGALLAQDGLNVAIVEREQMPRPHVGESLIPGVLPALAASGALDAVESAGFTRKYGATYVWGRSRKPWTVKFNEVYPDQAFSYQVDRAKFDKLLLDHASSEGVAVCEGTTALGPLGTSDNVQGACVRDADGHEREIESELTIDATGQDALFGRHFRTREFNESLRHVALYGYWSGGHDLPDITGSDDPEDAGNIIIVTVAGGWIWHIPIAHDMRSVGLVTDPAAIAELNAGNRTAYFLEQVRGCSEISALLDGAEWTSDEVITLSDWSFFCSRFAGPGYLQVGDAACFPDPILSGGVTLAVNGAVLAARAIRTCRATPWLHELALDWYDAEYRGIASNFADMAIHWYLGNSTAKSGDWFWRAKQLIDPASNFSVRQAFIHLASGVGEIRNEGGQLQHTGGYSPRQLNLIYKNLDVGLDAETKAEVSKAEVAITASEVTRAPSTTAIMSGCPRLRESITYQAHMAESGDMLLPITRITRTHPNAGPQHGDLPIAALPVVQHIDGENSGTAILAALRTEYGDSVVAPQLHNLVTTTLISLAEMGAIDIT